MESSRSFQSHARSTSLDGLCDVVTDGVLIQGLRCIADLAKIGVLGALLGALFSIVLIYVLGGPGVTVVNVGLTWMGVKCFGINLFFIFFLIVPVILQSSERSEAEHSSNYGLSVP